MTASTNYSWSPVGQRLYVPYEAPQGRRVNAIGALFHHSQRFEFLTRAKAPKCKKKIIPKAAEGLEVGELGTLNAAVFIAFVWQIAGRPENAPSDWRREKPLVVVVDNYSVHQSQDVKEERLKFQAADIDLFSLPSYSPELSAIEPVWHDVKQHRMRRRSRDKLVDLKRDVDILLTGKATSLRQGIN